MKYKIIPVLFAFLLLSAFTAEKKKHVTIFMIGDSTMANKPLDNENQERGWGQMLPGFLTEEIAVDNRAKNGRSSLSFINRPDDRKVNLFESGKTTAIYISPKEKPVVQTALSMLQKDVKTVFNADLVAGKQAQIIVGTLGINTELTRLEDRKLLDLSEIRGKWEAFQIQIVDNRLFVIGSDPRGTAYGLLELSRLIGVSPWYWWADVKPEEKKDFSLPAGYKNSQSPSVRYRGIFLNDEDWGLLPWANQTFEPGLAKVGKTKGAVGPKTYEKIFELLLRLRANTIWPAMHECTAPFYFTEGNQAMADKYGIVVGTSHCEPLMRNSATEWDIAGKGDYNYLTNKNNVLNYWTERLKTVRNSENIFTVGMRGKHDGMMQGVKTLQEHKDALSEIIPAQQNLLKRYIKPDIDRIPQVFVPYKEVLEVYDAGLKVPEHVTLMWCDDNYGYIRRLSNEQERQRAGGSGVYYHVSYWGRPHDYLWLASTSPALLHTEMKRAYGQGADRVWVLNAGDIKPAEYLTEFFLDLAWNINSITNYELRITDVFKHTEKWAAREFGNATAPEITAIMKAYYRLANYRKPEHTGWNRVEEPDYPRGITPVMDSEYNPLFNNELNRRIDSYLSLEKRVKQLKPLIPAAQYSAFFELVEYPVRGAALMNQKWLYAQLAHLYARINSGLAKEYAGKSMAAYHEIERISQEYNRIENGKWQRMMDFQPRKLPVFDKPAFPRLDSALTAETRAMPDVTSLQNILAKNAVQAVNPVDKSQIVEGLGHSFAAVQMKQGESLSFVFDVPKTGKAKIKIATIPNHDVDGQGMKMALSIDGKEIGTTDYSVEGRSEAWKQNVLRGQAISVFDYHFVKAGPATITVKALTPYIILDQIAVDMSDGAKFYEFPVNVEFPAEEALVNGVPWYDQNNAPVNTHGACLLQENGRYYLFGEYKTDCINHFNGFSCYSSYESGCFL